MGRLRQSVGNRTLMIGVDRLRTFVRHRHQARRITKAGNALARRVLIEGAWTN
jgi:transposase